MNPTVIGSGLGEYATGTIVSADGLVVTLLGSEKGQFRVILNDGKKRSAKLVAVDRL